MSPDNLRLNGASERKAGREALTAAERLLEVGLWLDAASRAYYAAFHLVRVLLWAAGESPKTHKGVAHLLRAQYVETGKLPNEILDKFLTLQRFREVADYTTHQEVSEAEARAAAADARALVDRISSFLGALGA